MSPQLVCASCSAQTDHCKPANSPNAAEFQSFNVGEPQQYERPIVAVCCCYVLIQ